ncbi:hypothetical protein A4X13_0g6997 [Tilletia indica]|uniref:Uncharacterized protein n=1 Tax=Tilletia indica TaxID=43049 RepID=A0A177TBB8_9BASI|nr:hypothetical protein A4X13_0g6997 [Tilletia indica]
MLSSDNPTTMSVQYAVQVAFISFSPDLREEVNVELQRLHSASVLALQDHTTSRFPLMLPLEGKLPSPIPTGTNWDGVQNLVNNVRDQSSHAALRRQQSFDRQPQALSPPTLSDSEIPAPILSRTYAQLIAQDSPGSGADEIPVLEATGSVAMAFKVEQTPEVNRTHDDPSSPPCTNAAQPCPLASTADLATSTRSSSTEDGAFAITLERVRQGWIRARRALMEDSASFTGAVIPSFPPSTASFARSSMTSSRSSKAASSLHSIEAAMTRIQAALFALRSDIISVSHQPPSGLTSVSERTSSPTPAALRSVWDAVSIATPSALELPGFRPHPRADGSGGSLPSLPVLGSWSPPHLDPPHLVSPPPHSYPSYTPVPRPPRFPAILASDLHHLLSRISTLCCQLGPSILPPIHQDSVIPWLPSRFCC